MALIVSKQATVSTTERWENFDKDTKVLLRGLDNEEYKVALERARRRLNARDAKFGEFDVGVVPGEESEHAIQCKLLGQFVLRDWEGAQDEKGGDVPYTPEAGAAALRGNIEFFVWVIRVSSEIAAESRQEREETLGKSSSTTAGTTSGAAKAKSSKRSPPASE
ncbi:hypothetical protein ACSBPU_12760 [Parapusillimonas sp. JC17]|uniref:hypothetical protein n=1 Tax=Parapusillimonas sp. JC17 TaxID=3445768 RepID=UPI003FA0419D